MFRIFAQSLFAATRVAPSAGLPFELHPDRSSLPETRQDILSRRGKQPPFWI